MGVVANGLEGDPDEHFADLIATTTGIQERLDSRCGNMTAAHHEFAREIDQRVEFRISHRLPGSDCRDDRGGNFEHALSDRAMGSGAIGAFVDDAGGQEDQLPLCGTQCGFAIGCIEA